MKKKMCVRHRNTFNYEVEPTPQKTAKMILLNKKPFK